jgi:hypothetical protein
MNAWTSRGPGHGEAGPDPTPFATGPGNLGSLMVTGLL